MYETESKDPKTKISLDTKLSDVTLKEFLSVGYSGLIAGMYRPQDGDNGPVPPWGPIGHVYDLTPLVVQVFAQNAVLNHRVDQLEKENFTMKKNR